MRAYNRIVKRVKDELNMSLLPGSCLLYISCSTSNCCADTGSAYSGFDGISLNKFDQVLRNELPQTTARRLVPNYGWTSRSHVVINELNRPTRVSAVLHAVGIKPISRQSQTQIPLLGGERRELVIHRHPCDRVY
ncbi:unnamed protein product [Microthlaspi erraticum]|uniref:Uncharacterized protein n=1 Tax=Microthlaspi erraticum TaxID=1685480 RepID=A0A6D2JL80_9BRAS|nr:unnamed protein product [Microthlaspi erraticum]